MKESQISKIFQQQNCIYSLFFRIRRESQDTNVTIFHTSHPRTEANSRRKERSPGGFPTAGPRKFIDRRDEELGTKLAG